MQKYFIDKAMNVFVYQRDFYEYLCHIQVRFNFQISFIAIAYEKTER